MICLISSDSYHEIRHMEKAKRDNRTDYYSQGCAFNIIGLMFLLLTLFTSNEILGILPMQWFFYFGSMMMGMALFGFTILLASAWRNLGISMKYIFAVAILASCTTPLFYEFWGAVAIVGSWIFAFPYIMAFQKIPAIVFPLMLIITFVIGIWCAIKSITIPRNLLKQITYLIIFFAIVYIWGHAIKFESRVYDEKLLEVEGKTYHSMVYYGWLGDPGLIYLYECSNGIFGCDLIYETADYAEYRADETSLVYDESTNVLRLEYQMSEYTARYNNIPPILYEHPVR